MQSLSFIGLWKNKLSEEDCDYIISRLAIVFNLNKDNNFIAKIKKLSKSNQDLKIVYDHIANPSSSFDISRVAIDIIEKIINKGKFVKNIYHLVSSAKV